MANPMGETKREPPPVDFDLRLKPEFPGGKRSALPSRIGRHIAVESPNATPMLRTDGHLGNSAQSDDIGAARRQQRL